MSQTLKCKVRDGQPIRHRGVVFQPGEEFTFYVVNGIMPSPAVIEILEGVADVPVAPVVVQPATAPATTTVVAEAPQTLQVERTQEGVEIVADLDPALLSNPALLKAKVKELESQKVEIVESDKSLAELNQAPEVTAEADFVIQHVGFGKYNVVSTLDNKVVTDEPIKGKDEALKYAAELKKLSK